MKGDPIPKILAWRDQTAKRMAVEERMHELEDIFRTVDAASGPVSVMGIVELRLQALQRELKEVSYERS